MSDNVTFTLNGERRVLTRAAVERCASQLEPGTVQKWGVRVSGTMFPVRRIFGAAMGLAGADVKSQTARRYLAALGFEIHDASAGRGQPEAAATAAPRPTPVVHDPPDESWHTEANVQAAVVTWLASHGWQILSVARTSTREHGIDVVASRGTETVGVEVKGFPSRSSADPRRAGEAKRTQPSTQAGHWYSQAVLAAMRLRTREPAMSSVIALPRFPRYESLFAETRQSLDAAGIAVWWVRRRHRRHVAVRR